MSVENVKVGDLVRLLAGEVDWVDMTPGKGYEVLKTSDNAFLINDDAGDARWMNKGWDEFELAPTLSPNDIVRLKSGETFTTGSFTAEVDSTKGDIVLLKHGSWLAVDAVEKVEAWVPEGDGWIEYRGGGNPVPGAKVQWLLDWERRSRDFTSMVMPSNDLSWGAHFVAYRVVEPAPAPAAEPAAETKPKFKVGDRVLVKEFGDTWETTIVDFDGADFVVEKDGGWQDEEYGPGSYWYVPEDFLTYIGGHLPEGTYAVRGVSLENGADNKLTLTMELDTTPFRAGLASLQADIAAQFQRIADALRAA